MEIDMAENKREKGKDEDGNALKSVSEYEKIIEDAEKKMALAKVDDKKDVVEQMKKDIVKYELTIGDLRGDAQKQLMSKSKSWTYTPPPKKK
tara:strand:+ start:1217 stop:1492 length:276 start_codon:yes stop_codon:yes gene_type:complete